MAANFSVCSREKKRRQEAGETVLTIDIGDHVDRFHSISEATNGLGNTKLLNEALYDYVTIGNNEGITLAKEHLNRLYDDAGFEVLVANLFEKKVYVHHGQSLINYIQRQMGLRLLLSG